MINGIWKNILYPEKFYTLSIHFQKAKTCRVR